MQLKKFWKRKRNPEPRPINVISNAVILVPTLELLLKRGVPSDLSKAAIKHVEGFSYGLPTDAEKFSYIPGGTGQHLQGKKLVGTFYTNGFLLNDSVDAVVEGCVIRTHMGVLDDSIRPTVRWTVVTGSYALNGNRDIFYRQVPKEQFYMESPYYAFTSLRQYQLFVKLQENIMLGDPKRIFEILVQFSRTINQRQYADALKYVGHTRELISDVLENLRKGIPSHRRGEIDTLDLSDERLIVAAHLIYAALNCMSSDAYHININDSIVLANRAFNHVKGGTIKSSIIAGNKILEEANVTVENSYLVTPEKTRFVEKEVFGKPEAFARVPPITTKKEALWEIINHYRDPAIQVFRLRRDIEYAATFKKSA